MAYLRTFKINDIDTSTEHTSNVKNIELFNNVKSDVITFENQSTNCIIAQKKNGSQYLPPVNIKKGGCLISAKNYDILSNVSKGNALYNHKCKDNISYSLTGNINEANLLSIDTDSITQCYSARDSSSNPNKIDISINNGIDNDDIYFEPGVKLVQDVSDCVNSVYNINTVNEIQNNINSTIEKSDNKAYYNKLGRQDIYNNYYPYHFKMLSSVVLIYIYSHMNYSIGTENTIIQQLKSVYTHQNRGYSLSDNNIGITVTSGSTIIKVVIVNISNSLAKKINDDGNLKQSIESILNTHLGNGANTQTSSVVKLIDHNKPNPSDHHGFIDLKKDIDTVQQDKIIIDGSNFNHYLYPHSLGHHTYELSENLTIMDNSYFIFSQPNVTFDGCGNTITINGVTEFDGLFQNGEKTSSNYTNGFNNITIQNINIVSNGSTLNESAGWLCRKHFGENRVTLNINCRIINCSSTGNINARYAGGLIGSNAANMWSSMEVIKCYSIGIISGIGAGGIFGATAANGHNVDMNDSILIKECYFTGNIIGNDAGGIFGNSAANYGKINMINCYSRGDISANYVGGLIGSNSIDGGSITITNCYSSGDICGGANVGGIFGDKLSNDSILNINNCYIAGKKTTASGDVSKNFIGNVDSNYTSIINNNNNLSQMSWDSNIAADILTGELNVQYSYSDTSFNDASYIWFNNSEPFIFNWQYGRISVNNINMYLYDSVYEYTLTANEYRLTGDIIVTDDSYFKFGADNVIFDGKGYTVTISGVTDGFNGLFENGTDISSGKNNINIKNLDISSSNGSILNNMGGWLCKTNFSKSAHSNITNCNIRGNIDVYQAGGFFGSRSACNGGTMQISNCSARGNITSDGGGGGSPSGGFFGSEAAFTNGNITVTNCYSSGDICGNTNVNSGGIIGGSPTVSGITISGCYIAGKDGDSSKNFVGGDQTFSTTNSLSQMNWNSDDADDILRGVYIYPNIPDDAIYIREDNNLPFKLKHEIVSS